MKQHELTQLAALTLAAARVRRGYLSRHTQTMLAAGGLASSLAVLPRGE